MDNNNFFIDIPKMIVSDDFYIIHKLFFENGSHVNQGDIIGSCETSKSTFDIESPKTGYIFYNVKENDEVEVGSHFAIISNVAELQSAIFEKDTLSPEVKTEPVNLSEPNLSEIRFSKLAKKMIEQKGIDVSVFKGRKVIESRDVEEYLKNKSIKIENKANHKVNNKVILIGCGGLTKMVIDILRQLRTYEIVGIIDSYNEKGTTLFNSQVLGSEDILDELFNNNITNAIITFAGINVQINRQKTFERLKTIGYSFPNIIHPKALIEPSISMGEGNIILAGAIVGSDARIGDNCLINTGAILSHDSVLENNVHLAPGAILAGRVKIGSNSLIGMGATVYMDIQIGEDVIVNNGVNVITNIIDGSVVRK